MNVLFDKIRHLFAFFSRILSSVTAKYDRIRHPLIHFSAIALLLYFILELLARRSLAETLMFFSASPIALIYNTIIIFATLCLSLAFHRRRFIITLISALWLGLGITNCILQSYRTAPLTAIDFALLRTVWSILLKYLKPFQIAAVLAATAAAIYMLYCVYRRCRPEAVRPYFALTVLLCAYLAVTVGYALFCDMVQTPESGVTAKDTAEHYGFVYCFTVSIFDRGIDKPQDYSSETIDAILADLNTHESTETAERPNIIFVQLESFFDVNQIVGVEYSENPVPVFSALEKNCPSGELIVPSLATGTANTEFEILTGMNLDYFGVGEYPYQTVLQTETCESMAYNMKALGYTAHAVHNHSGDFYDRQHVFSNLGFDTFTSVEYMNNVQRNPIGWAKDAMLTPEILKALGSTSGEDFVYAISVQAHGQYPKDAENEMALSAVDVEPFSEETQRAEFDYYLSQIKETDAFIGELINALERYNHPVVLVLFGDHLPGLGFEKEDLKSGSLYETQYVIWNNIGLVAPNRSLYAYQLSAYVQILLNMDSGLFTKLHQSYYNRDDYQQALELLQYDYLYGNRDAFGGCDPYVATDIQMGVEKIKILSVSNGQNSIAVRGKGFTAYSRIMINGKLKDTEYVNGALFSAGTALQNGDLISVAQVSDSSGAMLSQTDEYVYRAGRSYASPQG
ncbi:MAG: LTA synthase family protein [Oscillospiraceae bacterium]